MKFLGFALLLIPAISWGHARLVTPTPRSNNAGIKTGPCGGLAATTPTVVPSGGTLAVHWEETIQHPGKFLISLSMANDANFTLLSSIPDNQNNQNDLPHEFNATVQLPNVTCDNCTLQLIQSMEENPAAPSYYYSCADIKIAAAGAATPTPPTATPPVVTPPVNDPGSGVNTQNLSVSGVDKTTVGGCGQVALTAAARPPSGPTSGGAGALLLTLPFFTYLILRRRLVV